MKKKAKALASTFIGLTGIILLIGAGNTREPSSFTTKLTTHRWTLTAHVEKKDNLSVDLTDLQTQSERDKVVVYREDGSYALLKGNAEKSPGADSVMAEGNWSIDEQRMIFNDRFSGGSQIEKKIITLNDEMFVLQYPGEGNKEVTVTYISEQALKKDEFSQINMPEGKMARKIGEMLNAYLEETNHYNMVLKKDIENNTKQPIHKTDTARKTALLWPLLDSRDTLSDETLQQALFAMAAKHKVRYVLTGRITELKTFNTQKGIKAKLRYQLNVLDTVGGNTYSNIFEGESGKTNQNQGGGLLGGIGRAADALGKAGQVLGTASAWIGTAGLLMQKQALLQTFWKTALTAQALSDKSNQTRMLFSNIPEKERKQIYDSATAVNEALAETLEKVETFITGKMAYTIRILGMEGSGKDARLMIAAGSNIRLKENETLQLVQLISDSSNEQPIYTEKPIGILVVAALDPDNTARAWCVEKGKKAKVIDVYESSSEKQLFIIKTMRQQQEKKE
jgi:hypothetical protein